MSGPGTPDADRAFRERGVGRDLGAFVVGAAFEQGGAVCGFALGDGTVRLAPRRGDDWRRVQVHDGAALSLCTDAVPGCWLTGGDDGALMRVAVDGTATRLRSFGAMKWVEHVAAHADPRSQLVACSVGRRLFVMGADGAELKTLEHPSAVAGIAFDARGKRVGAAHYNGASLWFVNSRTDNPRRLEWKGSHTGIAISPDGDSVVTAMQENALHGWRLSDGQHMRMSGYPSKTACLSFTRSGRWLATSGAESVVVWPFHGGGPMGKAPTELAGGDGVLCTRVAAHPSMEVAAAGFSDGLVVLVDIATQRILPVLGTGRGSVSALAWSPDGGMLALGTETGFAAQVDMTRRD